MGITEAIYLKIIADTQKAVTGMVGFGAAVGAAFFALRELVKVGKESEEKFFIQERAAAKLDAVLKSTGGAAGFTGGELRSMASELQKVTTFGDETTMSGQAVLATFVKIGREVFPQAIEAAADMSTVMGQDLQSSIVQIGKALNDPIQGVTALRRVGVQLTDQQEEQIKSFMAANDVFSAQKIILKELETEFGGAARAMGDTAYGASVKLQNAVGDLQEQIGETIATGMQPFREWLTKIVQGLTEARAIMNTFNRVMQEGFDKLADTDRQATLDRLAVVRLQVEAAQWRVRQANNKLMREEAEAELRSWQAISAELTSHLRVLSETAAKTAEANAAAAKAAEEEQRRKELIAGLMADWEQSEQGQLAAIKKKIELYSSGAFEQNSQIVKDVLKMYRAQLPVVEDIADAASAFRYNMEDIRSDLPDTGNYFTTIGDSIEDIIRRAEPMERVFFDANDSLDQMANRWVAMGESSAGAMIEISETLQAQQDAIDGVGKTLRDMVPEALADTFVAIGDALGQGTKGAESFSKAMGDLFLELLDRLPLLFITAGLEVLIKSGGKSPAGWALLALGGVTGIGAGLAHASANRSAAGGASAPGVAAYAAGGIVTRPTLAVVGEVPEVIVPLGRMGLGAPGGTTVNIYGSVIADRRFDSRIAAAVARKSRGW